MVPKVKDHITLGDYTSISLIGCLYKKFAKIIAEQWKEVIGLVVDEVQAAYISEGEENQKQIFLFKADFEKAFYTLTGLLGLSDGTNGFWM